MDAPQALAAIELRRTQSLTAIVSKELERMILSGEIKAGERLNEQLLATRLGVSRGPVREATRALERAGLEPEAVRVAQGEGRESVRDLVREVAAREAVRHAAPTTIDAGRGAGAEDRQHSHPHRERDAWLHEDRRQQHQQHQQQQQQQQQRQDGRHRSRREPQETSE